MRTLYLECAMGAAGDMLTAALLDLLSPEEQQAFLEQMNRLLPGVQVKANPAQKCGVQGLHVQVLVNGEEEHSHDHGPVHPEVHPTPAVHEHPHEHGHDHEHAHEHPHEHDHEHEHEHHHDHDGEECCCGHDHGHDHDHHGHHHADDVFTSWGMETPASYSREKVESILKALENEEKYGFVLRAKGMVPAGDGTWVYFDYVPEESNVREGKPDVTGKFCVIGSKLKEDALKELFTA